MRISNPEQYELIGYELGGKKSKYLAILKNKPTGEKRRIPFGQKGYQQYFDKLGHYSAWDHNDEKRKDNWIRRYKDNIKHKFSSGYFAERILWS